MVHVQDLIAFFTIYNLHFTNKKEEKKNWLLKSLFYNALEILYYVHWDGLRDVLYWNLRILSMKSSHVLSRFRCRYFSV